VKIPMMRMTRGRTRKTRLRKLERPRVGRGRSGLTCGFGVEVNRGCKFITATEVATPIPAAGVLDGFLWTGVAVNAECERRSSFITGWPDVVRVSEAAPAGLCPAGGGPPSPRPAGVPASSSIAAHNSDCSRCGH
jgi:hypothetical protein